MAKSFRLQFLETLSALLTSAFGLVAALAWNTTIQAAVADLTGTSMEDPSLSGLAIYALLVTVLAVVATMIIAWAKDRTTAKIAENDEAYAKKKADYEAKKAEKKAAKEEKKE